MKPEPIKPEPIVVTIKCSLCDQSWEAHGDDPTPLDCIRLLKAELAKRPHLTIYNAAQSNTAEPWNYPREIRTGTPPPTLPQTWCLGEGAS